MWIKAIFFPQNSILLKVNEYRKLTGSAETKKNKFLTQLRLHVRNIKAEVFNCGITVMYLL